MSEIIVPAKEDRKYCSSNTKYYKHSNASGELGHVNRMVFEIDENVLPEHLIEHSNFHHAGVGNPSPNAVYDEYMDVYAKAEEHKGKKLQKNATTFIDSVVSLSQAHTDKLINKKGYDWFRKAATQCITEWQEDVKEKYGYEPVGFNFHMDEGHFKEDKMKHQVISSRNYHGHCIFFNYNFSDGTAPHRKMTKKDFSNMQDMLADRFSKMGYIRGISKKLTKKNHLNKDQFIDQKLADANVEIDERLVESKIKLEAIEAEELRIKVENEMLVSEEELLNKRQLEALSKAAEAEALIVEADEKLTFAKKLRESVDKAISKLNLHFKLLVKKFKSKSKRKQALKKSAVNVVNGFSFIEDEKREMKLRKQAFELEKSLGDDSIKKEIEKRESGSNDVCNKCKKVNCSCDDAGGGTQGGSVGGIKIRP